MVDNNHCYTRIIDFSEGRACVRTTYGDREEMEREIAYIVGTAPNGKELLGALSSDGTLLFSVEDDADWGWRYDVPDGWSGRVILGHGPVEDCWDYDLGQLYELARLHSTSPLHREVLGMLAELQETADPLVVEYDPTGDTPCVVSRGSNQYCLFTIAIAIGVAGELFAEDIVLHALEKTRAIHQVFRSADGRTKLEL